MDQFSSPIRTHQPAPISTLLGASIAITKAESTANHLRLQPRSFLPRSSSAAFSSQIMANAELKERLIQDDERSGITKDTIINRSAAQVSGASKIRVAEFDSAQRLQLIASINIAGARFILDREPGAIKRAVTNVTADPKFEEKLKEANAKGLKAYQLFVASTKSYQAEKAESTPVLLRPEQQQINLEQGTNVSPNQEEQTPTVKDKDSSFARRDDQRRAIDQERNQMMEGQLKDDEKIKEKSAALEKHQEEKRMTEREQQLANIETVKSSLVID